MAAGDSTKRFAGFPAIQFSRVGGAPAARRDSGARRGVVEAAPGLDRDRAQRQSAGLAAAENPNGADRSDPGEPGYFYTAAAVFETAACAADAGRDRHAAHLRERDGVAILPG